MASVPVAGPEYERPYYGRARIVAGLALVGFVIVREFGRHDALGEVGSVQLGLLLGTALLFLGVEAGRRLMGGKE